MQNFSKMNGDKTGNSTSHGMQNCISYVNTPSAPAMTAMTAKQEDSVHVHALPVQNTSWSGPPAHCAHVHKPPRQVFKPGDLLVLRKFQHPHNERTSADSH